MSSPILDILTADYHNFPQAQTYGIYDEAVYFKDPLNQFRGRDRYQRNIQFIATWFSDIQLELHDLQRQGNQIRSDWTLAMTTPLPWKPRIVIQGWSELAVNEQELIISHIDYWHCSRWDVVRQLFG